VNSSVVSLKAGQNLRRLFENSNKIENKKEVSAVHKRNGVIKVCRAEDNEGSFAL